jgi:hypothetical protein
LCLVLTEKHKLGVFENRALRKIFGLKGEEETGYWRRLHNEELHHLYCSVNIGVTEGGQNDPDM